MAEEVTLEELDLQLFDYKQQDLMKKMEIASNVFRRCEQLQIPKSKCHLQKTSLLTGVTMNTVRQIAKMEQKSKKFEDWIIEERRRIHGYHFGYLSLRNHLIENYTRLFQIPTNIKLNNTCEGYRQYCTTLQIPGTKSSIIVEKPETVLDRHRFLYTKMTHREAGRHIVYIGRINLLAYRGNFSYKQDNTESKTRFIIAASPQLGHLNYVYYSGTYKEHLTKWIQEKIEPELPRESVVIFQENVLDLFVETINSNSSKDQMIKYLETNNIPHDPTLHRAELYKLIKICKADTTALAGAEEILRAHGHITMRKTKFNFDNNYFDPFWVLLTDELNKRKLSNLGPLKLHSYTDAVNNTANKILSETSVDYWKGLDDLLLAKERQTFKEDLEMEHIIDQIITMAKNEGLPNDKNQPLKLDDYSKQLAQEHFFLSQSLHELFRHMKTIDR